MQNFCEGTHQQPGYIELPVTCSVNVNGTPVMCQALSWPCAGDVSWNNTGKSSCTHAAYILAWEKGNMNKK